jgi:hypothetical protein
VKTKLLNLIEQNPPDSGDGEPLSCKFIVIEHAGALNLVIGPVSDFRYHAALVDRFCSVNELPSGWVRKPDLLEIYDASVAIRGGGLAELDFSDKTCVVHGHSAAYGGFKASDIRQFLGSHALFETYQVTFK